MIFPAIAKLGALVLLTMLLYSCAEGLHKAASGVTLSMDKAQSSAS